MVFKQIIESDEELLDKIKKKFGYAWFTSSLVEIPVKILKDLERRGYLDISKDPYTKTFSFCLRKGEIDG